MNTYIEEIIKLAELALEEDNVPIGAVVVKDGNIIGKGYNKKNISNKVIDHAEIEAITAASQYIGDWRLDGCSLYVTLEPCNMCKEVIKQSRIKDVHYLLASNFYNEENRNIEYKIISDVDKQIVDNYKEKITAFFKNKR